MMWETYRLGKIDIEASFIRDIFALNDTDVWAVGCFNTEAVEDSLGFALKYFNAAHWDGRTWELKNISSERYPIGWIGSGERRFVELYSIWVFGHNDLVAYSKNGMLQWYDEKSTKWGYDQNTHIWEYIKYWAQPFPSGTSRGYANKMWATSKDDIYLCGDFSSLTHIKKGEFIGIPTDNSVRLNDIYGDRNGDVWTGGYSTMDFSKTLMRVSGDRVTELEVIDALGNDAPGHTIYISGDTLYIFVGNAIMIQAIDNPLHYRYTSTTDSWDFMGFIQSIRGRGNNDVFAVGDYGTIIHYNGKSWAMLTQSSRINQMDFSKVAVSSNYVFVSGIDHTTNQAVILIGRRFM
jgi:hypothetical protein